MIPSPSAKKRTGANGPRLASLRRPPPLIAQHHEHVSQAESHKAQMSASLSFVRRSFHARIMSCEITLLVPPILKLHGLTGQIFGREPCLPSLPSRPRSIAPAQGILPPSYPYLTQA